MAVLNILATSRYPINWTRLVDHLNKLDLDPIQIFPIPEQLGFEFDSIGVLLPKGYEKDATLSKLLNLVDFLLHENFKLKELYKGVDVSKDNALSIFSNMI